MPRISLTDFVDIVSKSGTPKATKVIQLKNRPEYTPAIDFYKPLREHVTDLHKNKKSISNIFDIMSNITDPKKVANYGEALRGYKKWWGKKSLIWFSPPHETFSGHGIEVSVNPELGLIIDGTPHVIKLYFKGETLSKNRIDIATHLMEICLRSKLRNNSTMSVLDIRNAKLISPTVVIKALTATLQAELAYIAALWGSV